MLKTCPDVCSIFFDWNALGQHVDRLMHPGYDSHSYNVIIEQSLYTPKPTLLG